MALLTLPSTQVARRPSQLHFTLASLDQCGGAHGPMTPGVTGPPFPSLGCSPPFVLQSRPLSEAYTKIGEGTLEFRVVREDILNADSHSAADSPFSWFLGQASLPPHDLLDPGRRHLGLLERPTSCQLMLFPGRRAFRTDAA